MIKSGITIFLKLIGIKSYKYTTGIIYLLIYLWSERF